MKFEINPNELTTEQRNHVSDFIRNWPTGDAHIEESRVAAAVDPKVAALKFNPDTCRLEAISTEEFYILNAEQASDMREGDTTGELREISGVDEARELGAVAADNLNAIFGQPSPQVPLDKEGLPWDSRIHSSRKAFIADGTWKLRRGVDPAEVGKVKAQLRELMAVPPLVTFTPAPIVPEGFTRVPGYEPAVESAPSAPGSIDQTPVPTPPAPKSHYLIDQAPAVVGVDAVVTHSPGHIDADPSSRIPALKSHYLIDQQPTVTLTDLISRISKAIAENRITQATVTEVCLKHRVSEFALLSNRPDLLPVIDADMKALGV